MPVTLQPSERIAFSDSTPNRRKWTRSDCEFLERSGLLTERYELIDGEVIIKVGQNRRHANAVMRLTRMLMRLFGDVYIQAQLPIDVADSENDINEPQPDLMVATEPIEDFIDRNPGPGKIALVVEIADSSVSYDLNKKAPLYARAGYPEYWVLDVVKRRCLVHRQPSANGYGDVQIYADGETITPIAKHDSSVSVSEMLGKQLDEER